MVSVSVSGSAGSAGSAPDGRQAGAHGHVVGTVEDGLDGGAEQDALPQLRRHAVGQLLRPADEAPLLRAAGGAGQVGEPAAGVEIEEGEEQRELRRARAEDRLDRHLENGPGRSRRQMGVEVAGECLRVEGRGILCGPWCVEGDVEGGQVQLEHAVDPVRRALGVRGRDEADVLVSLPVAELDPLPLGEGGEGGHAQFGGQAGQMILGRADPLTTTIHGEPRRGDLGERATADAVTGIHHQGVDPGPGQVPGGGQAGVPGPDDHHLALAILPGHCPFLPMGHRPPRSATIGAGPAGAARTPSVPCGVW